MRIVFLGTPDFAVPTLEALAGAHDVVLVVAQPDKRAGRGLRLQSPAVARKANELQLPLAQPQKIREALERVAAARPDLGVVVAYGKILPQALLDIPRHGFLNVHASLLPRYRGAAPIQRAIEHGERESGVTIMRVDAELDHGPLLSLVRTPIGADEHAPSLSARLSELGASELVRVLRDFDRHVETAQQHEQATYAPKIDKSEGEIRWTDATAAIYDKYRAFDPWPGVFTPELRLVAIAPAAGSGPPGTILSIGEGVVVATGDSALRLIVVQRPGKSRQGAVEFAHGAGWRVGGVVG